MWCVKFYGQILDRFEVKLRSHLQYFSTVSLRKKAISMIYWDGPGLKSPGENVFELRKDRIAAAGVAQLYFKIAGLR